MTTSLKEKHRSRSRGDFVLKAVVAAAAAVIGEVRGGPEARVSARGPFGASRAIDMLSGEQLPRIC
jgi:hydrogenase expression/formation protein HypE